MCATDLRPTTIVNGRGFKNLIHKLKPTYQIPSAKTVTKYLRLVYEETHQLVVDDIRNRDVAFTTDMWTSIAQESYITVTGHYIDNLWELNVKNLATRKVDNRHTGQNIAQHINDITGEYGVNMFGIVTDNAKNMVSAAEAGHFERVPCFAHTIQLCVTDALTNKDAMKAIAAGKRLVGHFSHSTMATSGLLEQQKRLSPTNTPLKLVQDVQTRWNSSFLMMKRLLHLRVAVYGVIMDEAITKVRDRISLDVSDTMWHIMEDLVPILEPFADVTEILGREDIPTSSGINVLLPNLVRQMEVTPLGSSMAKNVKNALRKGLIDRFDLDPNGQPSNACIAKSVAIVALFLDPRYKSMRFFAPSKRESIQDRVIELMNDMQQQQPLQPVIVKSEPDTRPPKNLFLECLRGDIVDLTSSDVPTF